MPVVMQRVKDYQALSARCANEKPLSQLLPGQVSTRMPVSMLQLHPGTLCVAEDSADA